MNENNSLHLNENGMSRREFIRKSAEATVGAVFAGTAMATETKGQSKVNLRDQATQHEELKQSIRDLSGSLSELDAAVREIEQKYSKEFWETEDLMVIASKMESVASHEEDIEQGDLHNIYNRLLEQLSLAQVNFNVLKKLEKDEGVDTSKLINCLDSIKENSTNLKLPSGWAKEDKHAINEKRDLLAEQLTSLYISLR